MAEEVLTSRPRTNSDGHYLSYLSLEKKGRKAVGTYFAASPRTSISLV